MPTLTLGAGFYIFVSCQSNLFQRLRLEYWQLSWGPHFDPVASLRCRISQNFGHWISARWIMASIFIVALVEMCFGLCPAGMALESLGLSEFQFAAIHYFLIHALPVFLSRLSRGG